MAEYYLIDSNGKVRGSKHLVGHLQGLFNEIKSQESIVYPWKVTTDMTGIELVITEKTTQQDWRDFSEDCGRLL